MQTAVEALRLLNALVATIVLGLLFFRGKLYWEYFDRAQRLLFSSYMLYVFAVAYTSFELFAQNAEIGLRSGIIFAANVLAVWTLVRYRRSVITGTARNRRS